MTRKAKKYWADFSNVEAELRPICEKLGRFPSTKEIAARGKSSLSRYGISKHGGVADVAKRLGYPTYDHASGRQMAGL